MTKTKAEAAERTAAVREIVGRAPKVATVGDATTVITKLTWTHTYLLASVLDEDERVERVELVHEGRVRVVWR